jgi:hypothetical protein
VSGFLAPATAGAAFLRQRFSGKLNSEDSSMASYVAVIRKEPNTAYWVDAPDIPGCVAEGETIEAAKKNFGEALVRQAKLGASCRVKVPVGRETRTVTRKG